VDDEPLTHPVYGVSGLTDPERLALARAAVDAVAARLGISDEQAAKFLESFEGEHASHIIGDQHEVSVYLNGRPLFPPITRARLRGVVHPGAN
jgi:hypothetical protein